MIVQRHTYFATFATSYPASIFSFPAATAAVTSRRDLPVFLASFSNALRSSCNHNSQISACMHGYVHFISLIQSTAQFFVNQRDGSINCYKQNPNATQM